MSTAGQKQSATAGLRRRVLLAVVLVTAAAVAFVLVLRASTPSPSGAPPPPATTPSAPTATTASPSRPTATTASPTATTASPSASPTASTATPTSRPTPHTTAPSTTALAQLQPFLSAARRMDYRLHAAARAINAAGPPWVAVTPELARTVKAADLDPVAATVPAGMPDELLLPTMTVFSDLASRRAAMQSFTSERSADEYDPKYAHHAPDELLAELANGVPAAGRFGADLAALAALARSSRPFVPEPATSRAEGERLLLLSTIRKDNFGCDSRGGGVITQLPIIRWTSPTSGTLRMPRWDSSIPFTAVRTSTGRYVDVHIIAC